MMFWLFLDRHPVALVIAIVWSAAILGASWIFSRATDSQLADEEDGEP